MRLEGHEVPTVFVHGHAPPDAVRDAEARLQGLCVPLHSVRFSVLWVESVTDAYIVGVELGVSDETISVEASGTTMRAATNDCLERLRAALSAAALDVSR